MAAQTARSHNQARQWSCKGHPMAGELRCETPGLPCRSLVRASAMDVQGSPIRERIMSTKRAIRKHKRSDTARSRSGDSNGRARVRSAVDLGQGNAILESLTRQERSAIGE